MNTPHEKKPHEETLRELLGRLHERLGRAGKVDEQSRHLLTVLTHDIERALGHAKPAGLGRESLARLEGLAARFESDHPGLAEVVRELMVVLRDAGI
jgi:hypothetical protein